jgi:hypothetical protein
MTKSGIGTANQAATNPCISPNTSDQMPITPASVTSNTSSNSNGSIQQPPTNSTIQQQATQQSIANAEIPIYISDKKKWVTGISKKTTINDLIFAILKQCQLIDTNSNANNSALLLEQIASKYVLIELETFYDPTANSSEERCKIQRILNNDTKVYKNLSRWSQLWANTNNNPFVLKILECQASPVVASQSTSEPSSGGGGSQAFCTKNDTNESSASATNKQTHGSSSLATKLLKKFGVSSASNINSMTPLKDSTSSSNQANQANTSKTTLTTSTSNSSNLNGSASQNAASQSNPTSITYKYIDVKLQTSTTAPVPSSLNASNSNNNINNINNSNNNNLSYKINQSLSPGSLSNNSNNATQQHSYSINSNSNLPRLFDPSQQKSILINSIQDKEGKLKQQFERFTILDELIKETEKKSKSTNFNNNSILNTIFTANQTNANNAMSYNAASSGSHHLNQNEHLFQQQQKQQQESFNQVNLNDIYCHFPEMSTHHLNEVEEFSLMCSRLFQLDETVKSKKQLVSNLDLDLQRELNNPQTTSESSQSQTMNNVNLSNQLHQLANNGNTHLTTNESSSPEIDEFRKEVNMSRETSRLQCKQLHDLDLLNKQNDQSLKSRETELQQLLEQLYIQEVYTDKAIEDAIKNTPETSSTTTTAILSTANNNNNNNNITCKSPSNLIANFNKSNSINKISEINHNQTNQHQNHHHQHSSSDTFDENRNNSFIELKIQNDAYYNTQTSSSEAAAATGQRRKQIPIYSTAITNTNDMIFNNPNLQQKQFQTSNAPLNQKSLSIGNLTIAANGVVVNTGVSSPLSQHQYLRPNLLSPNQMTIKNNLMKQSPSLDLNSNNSKLGGAKQQQQQQQHLSNGVSLNCIQPNSKVNPGDHSGGDNDSGISSMSSETTTTTTTAQSSSSSSSSSTSSTSSTTLLPLKQAPASQTPATAQQTSVLPINFQSSNQMNKPIQNQFYNNNNNNRQQQIYPNSTNNCQSMYSHNNSQQQQQLHYQLYQQKQYQYQMHQQQQQHEQQTHMIINNTTNTQTSNSTTPTASTSKQVLETLV